MFKRQHRRKRPSIWLLVLFLCVWGGVLGWGLAQAQQTVLQKADRLAQTLSSPVAETVGTVDVVPEGFQLGQELYLERCSTCHIAVPPAVLPRETWRELILAEKHYGVTLPRLLRPEPRLIWRYVGNASRALKPEELVPYRIAQSSYFKILHPRVKFSEPVTLGSCVSCHPGAKQFNFRSLTAEWQDAP